MYPTRSVFMVLTFMLGLLSQVLHGQVIGVPNLGFADMGIACANDQSVSQFQVSATAVGSFEAGNVFSLQLSDENGSFDTPTALASISSTGGSLNFSFDFPEVTHGTTYKVRVVSSQPIVASAASQDFELSTLYNVHIDNDADVICAGSVVTLTYTGVHDNIVWLKDNILIAGENGKQLTVSDAGTYRVQVDEGSCTASSNQVKLEFEVLPSASFDSDFGSAPCLGTTIELKADVRISSHIYKWYKDGQEINGLFQPAYTLPLSMLSYDDSGSYTLEVINAAGCSATSEEFELNVQGIAYTFNDVSDRIVSSSVATELSLDIQQSNISVQWERDGNPINGADQFALSTNIGGNYKARLQSAEGCEIYTEEIKVLEITGLSLYVDYKTDYTACMDGTVGLELRELKGIDIDGYFVDLPKSVENKLDISWYHNDENLGVGMQSITLGSASKDGDYKLQGTLLGISDFSNVLSVHRAPKAILEMAEGSTLCPDQSITIRTAYVSNYTYQWYLDGEALEGQDQAELEVAVAGSYAVAVSNGSCSTLSAPVEIDKLDEVEVAIVPDVSSLELPFGATQVLEVAGAEKYRWYDDRGDLLAIDQSLEVSEGGTYYLEVSIGSCTVFRSIEIIALPSYIETIPNVITPNGDGRNDLWELPSELSFSDEVRVLLIDQAGNKVIDTYNYQNDWDGTSTGFPGSLFYFVIYKDDVELAKGGLNVLR